MGAQKKKWNVNDILMPRAAYNWSHNQHCCPVITLFLVMQTRRTPFFANRSLINRETEASISPCPQIFSRSYNAGANSLFITKNCARSQRWACVFVEINNEQGCSHAIWWALATQSSDSTRREMCRDIIDSSRDSKIADY